MTHPRVVSATVDLDNGCAAPLEGQGDQIANASTRPRLARYRDWPAAFECRLGSQASTATDEFCDLAGATTHRAFAAAVAARRMASSAGVSGLSRAAMSGRRPVSLMSRPSGVR